jgi:pimeloyl-ACP methyl ester carboxylesterase
MRCFSILFVITIFVVASPASFERAVAAGVSIDIDGLTATGELEIAPEKSLRKDGVVMLVHGTLAHNKMEIIASLQELLKERGINTLAITLSLGLEQRVGMYDCALEHNHRHTDAPEEIAAWINWLKQEGAKKIHLSGHSRGGNQVAMYLANQPDKSVKKAILVAPMTTTPEKSARQYEQRYGVSLQTILDKAGKLTAEERGDELMTDTDFIYCPKARVTADAFLDYYSPNPQYNTPALLASIKQPVLVIAGDADKVVPDLVTGMNTVDIGTARLSVIEGADHFFRDLYAEDLADAIAEFTGEQ